MTEPLQRVCLAALLIASQLAIGAVCTPSRLQP